MLERASLEAALELLLSRTAPVAETELRPLAGALGLVSAGEIRAGTDSPPFDRSPLDGFALHSGDTLGASPENPVRLRIAGTLYTGGVYSRALRPGEALRIMTGAAMPEGADCMAPKEALREDGEDVLVSRPVARHENYIFRGEDIKQGELFLKAGSRLDFASLGMLAAMGRGSVEVYRPLSIGLCCIGDELTPADTPLEPGKIYNSNGVMLAARLAEYGFSCRPPLTLRDDPAEAAGEIASLIDALDILITVGSVSVGDKDIMGAVFDRLRVERELSRLAFKPGSAFLCGRLRGRRIFCLSGNPFAALATMELVARPVLAKLSRREDLNTARAKAVLRTPYPGGKSGARRFLRGRLAKSAGDGLPAVTLPEGHSSGRLFSLSGCNCLVDLEAGAGALPCGAEVNVVQLGVSGNL
ncbi:MAG: molybdopterin molybdotransferase MoeA [Spirochaetaceae bacterium]|jgi:molybdopterin molybdotransferase|nr:molybdopterin molybdotransferase MoeA [Spirochaetaceae bacterium]